MILLRMKRWLKRPRRSCAGPSDCDGPIGYSCSIAVTSRDNGAASLSAGFELTVPAPAGAPRHRERPEIGGVTPSELPVSTVLSAAATTGPGSPRQFQAGIRRALRCAMQPDERFQRVGISQILPCTIGFARGGRSLKCAADLSFMLFLDAATLQVHVGRIERRVGRAQRGTIGCIAAGLTARTPCQGESCRDCRQQAAHGTTGRDGHVIILVSIVSSPVHCQIFPLINGRRKELAGSADVLTKAQTWDIGTIAPAIRQSTDRLEWTSRPRSITQIEARPWSRDLMLRRRVRFDRAGHLPCAFDPSVETIDLGGG